MQDSINIIINKLSLNCFDYFKDILDPEVLDFAADIQDEFSGFGRTMLKQ